MQGEQHQDIACAVSAHRQPEEKPRFAPPPRRREKPAKPHDLEANPSTAGTGATKTAPSHQEGSKPRDEVVEAIRDLTKLSTDGPDGPEECGALAASAAGEDGHQHSKGKMKDHGSSGRNLVATAAVRAQSADNEAAAEARATAGEEAKAGLGSASAPATARSAAGADEQQEGSHPREVVSGDGEGPTEGRQAQGQEPNQEAALGGERSDQVTSDQEWEQAIVDLEREREASEEATPTENSNREGRMAREHSSHQEDIEAGDDGARACKSVSMRSVTSELSAQSRSSKISQVLAGLSGQPQKRRSSLKEPSPFELSMKAEKVARVFRFCVHGNGHEVRLRHRRAVWELLLDDVVIGNVIHDSGTAITREQHIIDFSVPSPGLSEPLMACARMMWIVPKFRWSYRLLVNGVEVPACYRALLGEISGISPPEVARPVTGGRSRFMSRLHGRRWTS